MIGIAGKRRIVTATLIAFAAWPLAHHVAVRRLDLSPWKGFAWSMYCVPLKQVRVSAVSRPAGRPLPPPGAPVPVELERARLKLVDMRRALRGRATPEDYAATLFRSYPEVRELEITVEQYGVDRRTSQLVLDARERTVHRREGSSAR